MATVNPTVTNRDDVVEIVWVLTSTDRDGFSAEWYRWADQTWVATGTWGGATLTVEGSADGTTWVPLSNAAGGTAATATANKAMTVIELPRFVRPNLTTAGSGATVTVTLLARRQTPLRT
jgi:hypothetical protein